MAYFEEELDKLKNTIHKIGSLAESQVTESVKALLSEPFMDGKEVKKIENKIDKLDIKIEELCQSIFALQQPVASDLRFIMSSMQIGNEIERIGDLAVNIIKRAKNIKEKHELVTKFNIADLVRQIEIITIKTNECFVSREGKIIEEIFALNHSINNECEKIIQLIIDEMKNDTKIVASGTNLVIVMKHLERISGHCTNIAEYVYFMVYAKNIKHEKYQAK